MAVGTTRKSIFVLGAGFIGTSVIGELRHRNYHVTVLVRRQANSDELAASGLSTVLGSLDDSDLITAQVEISDVVINTASSDHVQAALAILEGIQRRSHRGDDTIYIQTSGTGSLGDFAAGQFRTDMVFTDSSPDDINAVPDSNPHRNVDNAITSRQKEIGTRAKIAIILPPLIYGYDERYRRHSVHYPMLVRFAVKKGYAGYIGDGKSAWSTVHIRDLARGFMTLLQYMETAQAEEFLANPYFFCESSGDNEPSWLDVALVIGRELHTVGKVDTPEPRTIPAEAYIDCAGPLTPALLGMNSRSRALRLRRLGWRPSEKPWDQSLLEDEIPAILQPN